MKARIEELSAQVEALTAENARLSSLTETIRRNNAIFEALLANSGEGITLTGPDRLILRVVRGISGIDPNELIGVPIESLSIPEDRPIVLAAYRRLLSGEEKQVHVQLRVTSADSGIRLFDVTMTDMLDNPNLHCIVWNYRDVTENCDSGLKKEC